MEANKRSGVALLVLLLVAVSCLVCLSSARSHPRLDFLTQVMNEGSAAEAKCDFCICLLIWPPRCYCRDQFNGCPSWCKKCAEVNGKYICSDENPDQCKYSSPSDTNQMIKLPHGHA